MVCMHGICPSVIAALRSGSDPKAARRVMSRVRHNPQTTTMHPLYFDTQPGSYKLLELPSELCKLVENGAETQYVI